MEMQPLPKAVEELQLHDPSVFVSVWCPVVTEDEVALALLNGEEVRTPPGSLPIQLSNNGHQDAETENDPLNYNMEETKYVLWTKAELTERHKKMK